MSLNLPRTMDENECTMTCTKQRKKKQYALSQPCLHQLVKGRLLPQDGIGIIQSATPATQNDVPLKRESTACTRERATTHAKSSWGYMGVRCPFPDTSMAKRTVADTWTVKKTFFECSTCHTFWHSVWHVFVSKHGALHPEPTASGACDAEFWSTRGTLHPELAI